ncbi:MAG: L,D-transpeptidase [Hyphomicrobiales bacterium]
MSRPFMLIAFVIAAAGVTPAAAQPMTIVPDVYAPRPALVMPVQSQARRGNLGGGFIEFLFGDHMQDQASMPPSQGAYESQRTPPLYVNTAPPTQPYMDQPPAPIAQDPRYLRQMVDYDGKEAPGTIIIDTPRRFLFLVEGDGKAIRYGIGVGRPGFTWAGTHNVSSKKEWPDWRPPDEMLKRQPHLPPFMAGGPNNPLGARAMYLGSTLYRIHGSNEPWTIGRMVSSGCIRMRNEDVIDLYERVKVGTKVVVI